mgnify:CR=1 FL=1
MGKEKQGQLLHRRECETVTKEEAAEYLRCLGYDAIEEDGTVMIRFKRIATESDKRKLASHLREIGYDSSHGWMREVKE